MEYHLNFQMYNSLYLVVNLPIRYNICAKWYIQYIYIHISIINELMKYLINGSQHVICSVKMLYLIACVNICFETISRDQMNIFRDLLCAATQDWPIYFRYLHVIISFFCFACLFATTCCFL